MIENVHIRPLQESDLPTADRILRLAFGTFVGLPDPMTFFGDADYIHTRFLANRSASFAAEVNGELAGSNFVANWGSIGILGPLSVHPDLWDKGIAKQLLKSTMEYFGRLGTKHVGLFTWAYSPKHLALYQTFGFWPRFLTVIMAKQLVINAAKDDISVVPEEKRSSFQSSRYSEIPAEERRECLNLCRNLTNSIYDGLDLELEINAINTQALGDTVLLWGGNYHAPGGGERRRRLVGLAACHCGAASEAGTGTCYIKFGAVLPGNDATTYFDMLLNACESFAKKRGLTRIVGGVNTGRHEAYRRMISSGFRIEFQGVVMDKPNEPAYNQSHIYLIDDWR